MGKILGFFGGGIGAYVAVALGVLLAVSVGAAAFLYHSSSEKDVALGKASKQIEDLAKLADDNAKEAERLKAQGAINEAISAARADERLEIKDQVQKVVNRVQAASKTSPQPAGCPAVPAPILAAFAGVRSQRDADRDPGAGHLQPGAGDAPPLR